MSKKPGKFYSLPFLATQATARNYQKVSAEQSIRQNIKLILLTIPSQVKAFPTYGGVLNKNHFRLPDKRKGEKKLEDEIKEKVTKNLHYLIATYEPRLVVKNIGVTIHVPKPDANNAKLRGGKVSVEIKLEGKILGEEDFTFSEMYPLL